jgi:hypothetical protein
LSAARGQLVWFRRTLDQAFDDRYKRRRQPALEVRRRDPLQLRENIHPQVQWKAPPLPHQSLALLQALLSAHDAFNPLCQNVTTKGSICCSDEHSQRQHLR